MSRKTLFSGAIIIALICLVLAIYYAIPGVYHVLVSGSHPPLSPQPAHIILFLAVAVLGVLVAVVNRPRTSHH